jgi:hypothetical protein
VLAKICLIAILGGAAASHSCDIAGQWVSRGRTPSRTQTWIATDIANKQDPSDFNINWDIRHGVTGGNGTYVGTNGLRVQLTNLAPNGTGVGYQTGTFSPNCTAITYVGDESSLRINWWSMVQGVDRRL